MEGALTARPRAGRPADLDGLERLENAIFDTDRLSRRSLRGFLSSPRTDTAVVDGPEGPAAYAMIGYRAGSKLGRIFSLAVDPGFARQGLGRALLGFCEDRAGGRGCTAVRLEVRADNAAAIGLYERAGYRLFGRLDAYYEDGASALRFEKPL